MVTKNWIVFIFFLLCFYKFAIAQKANNKKQKAPTEAFSQAEIDSLEKRRIRLDHLNKSNSKNNIAKSTENSVKQKPDSYSKKSTTKQINTKSQQVQNSLKQTTTLSKAEKEKRELAIDSVVYNEDELIDKIFFTEGIHPSPSFIWYKNDFCDKKVRLCEKIIDSLPDEIIVQLVKKGENPFVFPVKKSKTSNYGWRWNRPHRGVDIGLNTGDPVHCCFDGVVRIAHPLGAYGNLIVVRHYNGLETVYGHLSKINVEPLQVVKAGDVIGLGGNTGRSTGPHLHFEVRFQYEAFDPEWLLDFETYTLRSNRLYLNKTYFGIHAPSKLSRSYYTFRDDKIEAENACKINPKSNGRIIVIDNALTPKKGKASNPNNKTTAKAKGSAKSSKYKTIRIQ